MLTESLSEEQIKDIQEVSDSLLIPYRIPPASHIHCTCSRCNILNQIGAASLEEPGGQYGPAIIPQLAGKISTKVRR